MFAQGENFAVDINSVYEFYIDKEANIKHQIFIENLNPNLTSKAYSLSLKGINVKNVTAKEGKKELALSVFERDGASEIVIYFTEVVAGVGKKREIILNYQSDSYLSRAGDIWDLYIPYLQGNPSTRNANVTLIVPYEIAKEAYITPHVYERTVNSKNVVFSFAGNTALNRPIRAIYGDSQVYEVNFNFFLENKSLLPKQKSIALPPDTNRQKVVLASISEKPIQAYIDEDGNWIYVYDVKPMSTKKIIVKMYVQVFSEFIKSDSFTLPPVNLLASLSSTQFWQSDDPEIQKLAKELKTPEQIYKYVLDLLEYNPNEARLDRERKGGKRALVDPKNSICTDYTDLFITLARAAGIPAREVIGYGYSDYRDKHPLSLVADVLHSWPEYWDEPNQRWVSVDPTWEDTSKKDYFNDFDTMHIAFVIHGKDTMRPSPPGMYTSSYDDQFSKQVFVSLIKPIEIPDSRLKLSHTKQFLPIFFKKKYSLMIENDGFEAIYQSQLKISGGNEKYLNINAILPNSIYQTSFEVDYGFLGLKAPTETIVSIADETVIVKHTVWDVLSPLLFLILIIFVLCSVFALIIFFFPKRDLSKPY